jgi:hypothetical protein
MQLSTWIESCSTPRIATPPTLGTSLVLNLEDFPELNWLPAYLTTLTALQHERDRLTQAIKTVTDEGDLYRNGWIEPYTKSKNGTQYTYHQLRWLTGERKKSGQPIVKTKHLSHRAVGDVRAAIARGHQVEFLEQQCQQVETQTSKLKHLVQGTGRRIQQRSDSLLQEGNQYER